jgi:hypothetical protein
MDPGTSAPDILPSARFDAPRAVNAAAEQSMRTGQALDAAADLAGKVEREAKALVDKPIFEDAVTRALSLAMELESGDAGFVHAKGRDALQRNSGMPLPAEYDKEYDARLQEIRDGLPNEAVKTAFAQQMPSMRRTLMSRANDHMVRQQDEYNISVQKGKLEVGERLVVEQFDDPERWKMGRDGVADAVRTLNPGMDEDGVKGEVRKAMTPLHRQVIQRMTEAGRVAAARDYFARPEVQDEMTDEAKTLVSGVLTVATNDAEGQRAAREVISTNPAASMKEIDSALVARFGDNTAALEVARREVRYQRDLEETSRRETESSLMRPVDAMLGDARLNGQLITKPQASSALSQLRISSPESYAKASALIDSHNDEIRSERRAAEDRARAAHERALRDGAKGDEASTSAWYTLKTNPQALRVTDLLTLRSNGILSEKHFNDLVGDKKSLIEKRTSDENILSDKAAVDMVLRGAEIETGKDGDPKKLAMFYERFNQRVRESGVALDQAGKIAIARELLGEVAKERAYWFDTTQRAFEVAVPAGVRAQIIAALRQEGKPVTETNIVKLYQEGQKK